MDSFYAHTKPLPRLSTSIWQVGVDTAVDVLINGQLVAQLPNAFRYMLVAAYVMISLGIVRL